MDGTFVRLVDGSSVAQADVDNSLASFYECDILITWNCKHLANASKTDHIRRVKPLLVTPLELLEQGDESET